LQSAAGIEWTPPRVLPQRASRQVRQLLFGGCDYGLKRIREGTAFGLTHSIEEENAKIVVTLGG